MRHYHQFALAVSLPFLFTFCEDSSGVGEGFVSMQDDCEPASFNAALGTGTCLRVR